MPKPDSSAHAQNDEALMLRYQRGEMQAFEVLFARYERPLQGMLSRRLGFNAAIAAEIAQETWLSIVTTSATYMPSASFRTYLYHIAHNKLTDFYRKQARDAGHLATSVDDCDESQILAAPPLDPEQHSIRQQAQEQLERALQQLPDHHRTILLYCAIQDMTVPEAAAALDITLECAKSRLRYAKNALKAVLQSHTDSEE